MNPNITIMTLANEPWAISADWKALLSLVREGTHYGEYSDEAEYYEGDYNFAYIYHFDNKWWVSEHFPFKEGGEMGLEELRDNRYCLGTELVPEALDDALCSIAVNHWMWEREQMNKKAMRNTSWASWDFDDIPF